MFGTVLTVAVTVLQLYVFGRVVPLPASRVVRWAVGIGGALLWTIFLVGRLQHGALPRLGMVADAIGMTWMAVLFITATCFLAVDGMTFFGLLLRPAVRTLRWGALITGIAVSVFAFIQAHRPPVVESYDVRLAGLPRELEGRTVIAISDLHLNSVEESAWLRARVRQVMAEKPDMIVLLGDIVEGHGAPDGTFADMLGGLAAPLGVWGVLGNHESHGMAGANAALLATAGVHVLRDSWAEVQPGLVVAGVNDLSYAEQNGHVAAQIDRTLQGTPGGAIILLSHAPVGAQVAASHGVSLMLSGHTHAGQIWPFSYVVRERYAMLDGRYTIGRMTALVCRGTGTWGPRMRLWRRSAILRITLHAA